MVDIGSTLLNVAAGVATGAVTAALSVRFALRRFRAERTWERKVAAYTDILDALYQVQKSAKMRVSEIEEGSVFDEAYAREAGRQAIEGFDAIRRAAIKGTFIVGPKAAAKLEEIVTAFDDPRYGDDWYEEVSSDLEIASKAIVELRALANADVHSG